MKIRYLPITCLYSSLIRENFMPLICISGKWLEKAGFITGNEVSVQVRRHGELVIKLIQQAEEKEVVS
jgi:HSP20-like domain of unknown function (DUF1813).